MSGRVLSVLTLTSLLYSQQVAAQQNPAAQIQAAQALDQLKVFVLVGEAAIHRMTLGLVTEPVVEVRDADDNPVEGATVIFAIPAGGPGGTFGGQSQFQATTNGQGQATTTGFMPNGIEGRFQIQVTATSNGRTGRAVINQANSLQAITSTVEPRKRNLKKWIIWGAIAAGAAVVVAVVLTSGSETPTVTLSPGSPSIGVPR